MSADQLIIYQTLLDVFLIIVIGLLVECYRVKHNKYVARGTEIRRLERAHNTGQEWNLLQQQKRDAALDELCDKLRAENKATLFKIEEIRNVCNR